MLEEIYRVVRFNIVTNEWCVSDYRNEKDAIALYQNTLSLICFTDVSIVKDVSVRAKTVYALE